MGLKPVKYQHVNIVIVLVFSVLVLLHIAVSMAVECGANLRFSINSRKDGSRHKGRQTNTDRTGL